MFHNDWVWLTSEDDTPYHWNERFNTVHWSIPGQVKPKWCGVQDAVGPFLSTLSISLLLQLRAHGRHTPAQRHHPGVLLRHGLLLAVRWFDLEAIFWTNRFSSGSLE